MTRPDCAPRLSRRALASACGLVLTRSRHARAQKSDVDAQVVGMTSRERVARMFMFPISGTVLSSEDDTWLRTLKPAGVILVGSNFGTPEEVRALVAAIHATNPEFPPLVALDQEGGFVSRIVDDPAPDAPTMGQLPAAEVSALARARAERLAAYGFDVNFAPVADVAFSSNSFMTGRAFGDDPAVVAQNVAAYLGGVEGTGVLHGVKHYPGHGRVSVDSHEALPVLDIDAATWWVEDALPFRVAVEAGVPMVMLGHLVVPSWDELPASLSPESVRVLREDLRFTGVVVSDDLGMGALATWTPFEVVDLAVGAGNDLLLFVVTNVEPAALVDHLAARVESGDVPPERVTASVDRLLRMHSAWADEVS
jgi:beta-N-acetylhexosaminidase